MAKELITIKRKVGVVRQAERDAYRQWMAIPAMLRLLPETELKKMGYDTDDPVFMKLLSIRTKKEFADFFKVGHSQPMLWEKEEGFHTDVQRLAQSMNVMKFQKDIDFAFTQKVLKHGDAHRMKLWKQLYEGWQEKTVSTNFNATVDIVSLVKEIESRNVKIRAEREE